MNTMTRSLALALTLLSAADCAPTCFFGEAKVPGGLPGCVKLCEDAGAEMASFIYMGEYSTACGCRPKGASSTKADTGTITTTAAAVGAATGIELQRRQDDTDANGQSR